MVPSPHIIPDNLLRCMSPSDKQHFGKAGLTAEEAAAKFVLKSEGDLQDLIAKDLLRRGIWNDCDAMHKKRTGPRGTPDFLFAVNGQACAVEAKFGAGTLSDEQKETIPKMITNGWRVAVVRSFQEYREFLRSVGIP